MPICHLFLPSFHVAYYILQVLYFSEITAVVQTLCVIDVDGIESWTQIKAMWQWKGWKAVVSRLAPLRRHCARSCASCEHVCAWAGEDGDDDSAPACILLDADGLDPLTARSIHSGSWQKMLKNTRQMGRTCLWHCQGKGSTYCMFSWTVVAWVIQWLQRERQSLWWNDGTHWQVVILISRHSVLNLMRVNSASLCLGNNNGGSDKCWSASFTPQMLELLWNVGDGVLGLLIYGISQGGRWGRSSQYRNSICGIKVRNHACEQCKLYPTRFDLHWNFIPRDLCRSYLVTYNLYL